MNKIIDTNIPIIANGDRSPQASIACRLMCVRLLKRLIETQEFNLVIDLEWIVLKEYKKHLRISGDGGVGNQFLNWVITNLITGRCVQVKITQQDDTFEEFPNHDERLKTFDPADRKWIAVALAHQRDHGNVPSISQAADEKWRQFVSAFLDYGVEVDFICDTDTAS